LISERRDSRCATGAGQNFMSLKPDQFADRLQQGHFVVNEEDFCHELKVD
jgi:hypothetical protein